jgi:hypothetical protein
MRSFILALVLLAATSTPASAWIHGRLNHIWTYHPPTSGYLNYYQPTYYPHYGNYCPQPYYYGNYHYGW